MIKPSLIAICFSTIALTLPNISTAQTHPKTSEYTATVQHIHDGDTIRAIDEHGKKRRIRLANIDAPEINQAHGIASRNALRQLLNHQTITIEVMDVDKYGRQVARIWVNGQDANLAQLHHGWAWHYHHFARQQQSRSDYQHYRMAEQQAQQQRRGLWANKKAVAPWVFRHSK